MFSGPMQITPTDVRKISAYKNGIPLGAVGVTADGRVYRWSQAGGATLAPGKINVAATVNTDVTNKTVARTYDAGVNQVIVDAAGAIAADAYADGFLTINDATGEGISYLVASNTVTAGAAELTVNLAEPTATALTIDVSEATLTKNPWDDIVISVADQLDMAVGIANVSLTTLYYGWVQTRGLCSALADESYAIGQNLTIGSSVVGALEANDAAGEQNVGVAIVAGVDTEYREVFLTID